MQTTIISKNAKTAFFIGMLLLAMLIGSSADAQSIAKVKVQTKDSSINPSVQVKYIGSTKDGVLFSVKYSNQSASPFTLVVSDADGEVLYEQTFTKKDFEKKFLLARAYDKMSFTIKNDKEKTAQTFAININSKEVEDFYVRMD